MCDRTIVAGELIDNHIHVWAQAPAFAPLARVIQNDRNKLIDRISSLTPPDCPNPVSLDGVRSFLIHYALEQLGSGFHLRHFVLFKEVETVQVVLEDCFGIRPGPGKDEILIPHQNEALRIMVQCIFHRHSKPADSKDVTAFMQLFAGVRIGVRPDQDRIMRFKSMVWLIYLTIEMIRVDLSVCSKGLEYFRSKFRELIESTLAGRIINEDSRKPGFDGGRWEDTLFGWLQGEDRKQFVLKLKRQFNLENRIEHANRFLLAEHRKCVLEQVMSLFC
jgi:hypothetical protein